MQIIHEGDPIASICVDNLLINDIAKWGPFSYTPTSRSWALPLVFKCKNKNKKNNQLHCNMLL